MELAEHLSDLVQRGATRGVIWHEVFDGYPQPRFRREVVPGIDPWDIQRDRSFWSRLDREGLTPRERDTRPTPEVQQLSQMAQMAQQQDWQVNYNALAYQGMLAQADPQATGLALFSAPPRNLCPEEQEAERSRREVVNAQIAAQQQEAAEALARARSLLVEAIGEEAVMKLDMGGTYPVPSKKHKGTEYHLRLKRAPVRVVIGGKTVQEICIQPTANMPDYDMVLALKKMIEYDETVLVGTGNIMTGRPAQITHDQNWFSRMLRFWEDHV
jgi:hypothetical protein